MKIRCCKRYFQNVYTFSYTWFQNVYIYTYIYTFFRNVYIYRYIYFCNVYIYIPDTFFLNCRFNLLNYAHFISQKIFIFFKNNNISKLLSVSRFLLGVNICPPVLNSFSTGALELNIVLYFI